MSSWHIGQAWEKWWPSVSRIHPSWHDLSRNLESVDDAVSKYLEKRPWHTCQTGCISIHTVIALNNESLYSKLIQNVQNSRRLRIAITDYERTDFLINRIQNIDAQHQMATTRQTNWNIVRSDRRPFNARHKFIVRVCVWAYSMFRWDCIQFVAWQVISKSLLRSNKWKMLLIVERDKAHIIQFYFQRTV